MIIDINAKNLGRKVPDDKYLGTHLICEYFGCDGKILNDIKTVSASLVSAAQKCNATILRKFFHKFGGQGISGVIVISESHISVHTWPERNYAAVDFFTCSSACNADIAAAYLSKVFKSKKHSVLKIKRGKTPKVVRIR